MVPKMSRKVCIFAKFAGKDKDKDKEIVALQAAVIFETMGLNVPADLMGIQLLNEYPLAQAPRIPRCWLRSQHLCCCCREGAHIATSAS